MPKRKRKKYSRPRKLYDKIRIEDENSLKSKYGLKSKREIWKAETAIVKIRRLAKKLITSSEEQKKNFIEKLKKNGFNVNSIADSLALSKEDWLKRRLQTILFKKNLANTSNQARQLITHKHVSIGSRIVNIPSYQVSLDEEPLIKLNLTLKTPDKKTDAVKEILEEDSINLEEKM